MTGAEAVARLRELALPRGHYVVHGSGALLLRGLVHAAGDLDILARGPAWLLACRLSEPDAGLLDPVVRPRPEVEIWGGWLGEDVDTLIDGAEDVLGWPCVGLATLLAFKERLGRPKDVEHVRLLRQLLERAGPRAGRRR